MAGINLGALAYDLVLNRGTWEQDIARAKGDVASIEQSFKKAGSTISTAGKSLTKAITLPIIGAAVAAVKIGTEFDSQMSRVQAIAGATGGELEQLREQALQLGADTAFSAAQAAEGMENLASAGFTTNEIMSAMPGLLDLAASSGAELAVASEIAASTLRGFGFDANQAGRVADVLAEAAARTNAQVEDMGEAMKYVAPVAASMGIEFEETAAAIGILSDAGIKGSQAGTTLRGALARLTKPTERMKDVMDNLGLSFYDSDGKMKSLHDIVQMLEGSMSGLTEQEQQHAITTLFGQEAMSGMLALIARGPDELAGLTAGFQDSEGAAKDMATVMLDNLGGAFEELSGSLETAGIGLYDLGKDQIKAAVQGITDLINAFNGLDDGTKKQILSVAGAAAAMGPFLMLTGKITGGLGGVMPVLGTVTGGLGNLGKSAADAAGGMVKNVGKIGGIGDKLSAPFKSIGGRVKESLSPLSKFGSFFQPMTKLLGPLNGGLGIFGKLVGGMFGAGGIVAIALTLLTTLAAGASAAGIDVESMIGNVVEGVTNFATSFAQKFQEIAPKIIEAFPSMLETITTGIIDMLDVLLPIGMDMIIMIIQGLAANAPAIITSAIDIVLKLVDSLILAAPMLIEAAFQLIIGIVEGLIDNADRVIDAAIMIMKVLIDSLIENLPLIIDKLPDIIIKIVDALIEATPMLIQAGFQLMFGLAKGIIQSLPAVFSALGELAGKLLDRIKGLFGIKSPSTVFANIGRFLIQGFINGIRNMIGGVVNIISNIGGTIRNGISGVVNTAKSWGSNLIGNISSGMSNARARITSAVSSVGNALKGGVSGIINKAKDWGADMMDGLSKGISNAKEKVANAAKSVASRISNFLHFTRPDEGPLREYEDWMPHMLDGMTSGLRKNTGKVLAQARELSQGMADTLNPTVNLGVVGDMQTAGTQAQQEQALAARNRAQSSQEGNFITQAMASVNKALGEVAEVLRNQNGETVVNVYEDGILKRTIREGKRKSQRAGKPLLQMG